MKYHRPRNRPSALRIVLVGKEPLAAGARGERHQSKGRGRPAWIWRSPEREPYDYLPEESRGIIGPVDSARRGALVREVPSIEEPAKSAAKKGQCVRSHLPKERRERHQNISRGRLEPEVGEGFHVSSLKKS